MPSGKVLVTGAAGFIGSHLVERLLRDGYGVKALIRYNSRNDWGLLELLPELIKKSVEVVAGDVRDPYMVSKSVRGCHTVFHLASLIAIPYSYVAPQSYIDTNVSGTLNVMQAALDHGVTRVVHTSTSECYGTARYVPIDEKHPLQGQSPYSASKIGADMIAESYYRSFGLPVATIRPFNTFGPRQSARAIVPSIIIQALNSSDIHIGSLEPTRDMNYVDDTVDGFVKVGTVEAAIGQVTNVGTGSEASIGNLLKIIVKMMGIEPRITVDSVRIRPEKSEVDRLMCNNFKAQELLDWKPKVGLEEGLRRTIEWFQQHLDRYKADVYNV